MVREGNGAIIVTSMRILPRGGVRLLLAGVSGVLILLSLTPVGAASANLSRSYAARENIRNGSLVSIDPEHADYVQLANTANGSRLVGVALASNDSLLAVDAEAGKVQVANSGTVDVLVSTLGGPVGVGDEIGVSPFSGIGMKAAAGSRVIGLAQTKFDKGSDGAVTQTVTDKNGKTSQLTIGYVRLSIAIANESTAGSPQLNSLQRVTRDITGRTVSTLRIILSLVVAVVSLLILITLIYASIYGSIVSIGRNPLAKYAVFRTLTTVIGIALITAVTAGVTIFFLLR